MTAVPRTRYLLFFAIAAIGCAVDLGTKHWIFAKLGMPGESPSWWLWDNVFGFTTHLNEGALFGVGQGRVGLFVCLSLVALGGILYWLFAAGAARDVLLTIALGCVTAGILGNFYDRVGLPGLVWQGSFNHAAGEPVYAVRDWLHMKWEPGSWPLYNIADSLLVCGSTLLVWYAFRSESLSARAAQDTALAEQPAR